MPPETGRFQRFVAEVIEREGALVEAIDPEGVEIVAPPRLQQALRIPEFCRLGFGATPPPGARRIGIESDWLDRLASLIGERGRWTRRVLGSENPPLSDVERLLEHELELGNAPYRVLGVVAAWTRYLILDFRFTALSDEKRDGTLRLGANLATGAMLDGVLERLSPWLDDDGPDAPLPEGVELPPLWDRRRILDLIDAALRPRLERRIEPFVKSLRRRLARDEERLHGYHNDLYREAQRRLAALPDGAEGWVRERQRIEAIARDYRAKLDDLGHKYGLRLAVEWVRTLDLAMPVRRIELQIRRRKGERVVRLDWNPLARRLERLPCEFSHAAERPRLACDDALHLVSPPGLAACADCGKPYCRACHRGGCPKCGAAAPRPGIGAGG